MARLTEGENHTMNYEQLLDHNAATCDPSAFDDWRATELWARAESERRALPAGTAIRNHVDSWWKIATNGFEQTGPMIDSRFDIPGERMRAEIDGCRVALQVCQWVGALRTALNANPNLPSNLWPRFPNLIQRREYVPFKVGTPFDIAAWLKRHAATLLDANKVRIADPEGRRRLKVRPGALSDADLVVAKRHVGTVVDYILAAFIDVDEDGLRGLTRAA